MDRNVLLAMLAAGANQTPPQKKRRWGCLGCGPKTIIAVIIITILIWLPWELLGK